MSNDQAAFQPHACKCLEKISELSIQTGVDRLSSACIIDYAQQTLSAYQEARQCGQSCLDDPKYDHLILGTLNNIVDFLEALWRTTTTTDDNDKPPRAQGRCAPTAFMRPLQDDRRHVEATREDTATFGRLTLDASETDLLIKETVRGLSKTINQTAVEALGREADTGSLRYRKDGRYAHDRDGKDSWRDLVDRTYRVLACYRNESSM